MAQEMPDNMLLAPHVIRAIWEATKGECTIATDVGQNQMWETQYFQHTRRNQLITSGGLGTMGFALPASIGAKLGRPEDEVWAIAGDGGFQMSIPELATLVQEKLNVKIAIINNGFLGMVRQWQQIFYEKRYTGTPMLSPDYVKLADAYDIPALMVRRPEDVVAAIEQAQNTPGPFLIDFRVKEEVNVYPMVPPGAAVDELIRRPAPSAVVQGYSGVEPSW